MWTGYDCSIKIGSNECEPIQRHLKQVDLVDHDLGQDLRAGRAPLEHSLRRNEKVLLLFFLPHLKCDVKGVQLHPCFVIPHLLVGIQLHCQ